MFIRITKIWLYLHRLISLGTALLLPPHTISLAAATHYQPCHCLVISALRLGTATTTSSCWPSPSPSHLVLSALSPLPRTICLIAVISHYLPHRRRLELSGPEPTNPKSPTQSGFFPLWPPKYEAVLSPSPPPCLVNLATVLPYQPRLISLAATSPALCLITLLALCLISLTEASPYQFRQRHFSSLAAAYSCQPRRRVALSASAMHPIGSLSGVLPYQHRHRLALSATTIPRKPCCYCHSSPA